MNVLSIARSALAVVALTAAVFAGIGREQTRQPGPDRAPNDAGPSTTNAGPPEASHAFALIDVPRATGSHSRSSAARVPAAHGDTWGLVHLFPGADAVSRRAGEGRLISGQGERPRWVAWGARRVYLLHGARARQAGAALFGRRVVSAAIERTPLGTWTLGGVGAGTDAAGDGSVSSMPFAPLPPVQLGAIDSVVGFVCDAETPWALIEHDAGPPTPRRSSAAVPNGAGETTREHGAESRDTKATDRARDADSELDASGEAASPVPDRHWEVLRFVSGAWRPVRLPWQPPHAVALAPAPGDSVVLVRHRGRACVVTKAQGASRGTLWVPHSSVEADDPQWRSQDIESGSTARLDPGSIISTAGQLVWARRGDPQPHGNGGGVELRALGQRAAPVISSLNADRFQHDPAGYPTPRSGDASAGVIAHAAVGATGVAAVFSIDPSLGVRVREVSASSGRVLYDGRVWRDAVVESTGFRLLAVVGVAIAALCVWTAQSRVARAGVRLPAGLVPAPADRRVFAALVDLALAIAVTSAIAFKRPDEVFSLSLLIRPGELLRTAFGLACVGFAIALICESLIGRTFGKRLAGIWVVSVSTERISLTASTHADARSGQSEDGDLTGKWGASRAWARRTRATEAEAGVVRTVRPGALPIWTVVIRNSARWMLFPTSMTAGLAPARRHTGDVLASTMVVARAQASTL